MFGALIGLLAAAAAPCPEDQSALTAFESATSRAIQLALVPAGSPLLTRSLGAEEIVEIVPLLEVKTATEAVERIRVQTIECAPTATISAARIRSPIDHRAPHAPL